MAYLAVIRIPVSYKVSSSYQWNLSNQDTPKMRTPWLAGQLLPSRSAMFVNFQHLKSGHLTNQDILSLPT